MKPGIVFEFDAMTLWSQISPFTFLLPSTPLTYLDLTIFFNSSSVVTAVSVFSSRPVAERTVVRAFSVIV